MLMTRLKRNSFLHRSKPFIPLHGVLGGVLLLIFGQQPAYAVRVDTLYEAAVPVASQSPRERSRGLQEILQQVVVKVSGQNVLPAGLMQGGSRLQDMVVQFGYESRQEADEQRLYLWAKLSQVSIKQLIRQAGLPVWPEERPATLLWLAVEDSDEQQVIAEDSDHVILQEIKAAAEKRGLPVIFPIMDLAESGLADYRKVAVLDPLQLAPVSEKYASQYVLMGHIQQVGKKHWRARWRVAGTQGEIFSTPVGPLSDVLAAAIDPLASYVASQFSSFSHRDDPQYFDVTIDDVGGAADYAKSLKYLQSLSPITRVDVLSLDGQEISYRLHTRADMAAVLQVIELGRVLYARDAIDRLVFGLNP